MASQLLGLGGVARDQACREAGSTQRPWVSELAVSPSPPRAGAGGREVRLSLPQDLPGWTLPPLLKKAPCLVTASSSSSEPEPRVGLGWGGRRGCWVSVTRWFPRDCAGLACWGFRGRCWGTRDWKSCMDQIWPRKLIVGPKEFSFRN